MHIYANNSLMQTKTSGTSKQSKDARLAIDAQFDDMQLAAKVLSRPRVGWVKLIRTALGMGVSDLAARLDVLPSTVTRMETNEKEGSVTLTTLGKAAEALNCDVVYALVPREPLESQVQNRAREIATWIAKRTQATMNLELQGLTEKQLQELIDRQTAEIAESRKLWRANLPS